CVEVVQALALAVAMVSTEELADTPQAQGVASAAPPATQESVDRTPNVSAGPPKKGLPIVLGVGLGASGVVGRRLASELSVFGGVESAKGSLRGGVGAARSETLSTPLGTARLERWALRVEGCPITVRPADLRMSPCVRLDGGVLRGIGESIQNA